MVVESQSSQDQASKPVDMEKMNAQTHNVDVEAASSKPAGKWNFFNRLLASSVEARGVMPVPLEERTSTNYSSYFSIWFCMNVNLLP
jgi:hypothetical protein